MPFMPLPPPSNTQARLIWLALTGLAVATMVALIAGAVWGLGCVVRTLAPVLWPLAVAGVIAYLLDPVVDFFERRRLSRPKAIVSVFGLALLAIAILFGSILPPMVSESRQFVRHIPDYAVQLEHRAADWLSNLPPWAERLLSRDTKPPATVHTPATTNSLPETFSTNQPAALEYTTGSTNRSSRFNEALEKENLQTAASWAVWVVRKAGSWLGGQVLTGVGFLAGLVLVPVYAFYFLLEKRGISSRWTNYLPVKDSRFKDELVFVLDSINGYLIAFFRGQVLVALCDGILYGLGFLIVGLPYALLIGAVAVVLTIIPFLGAILICAASLLIAVVQYGDLLHPLLVLAVFGFVQAMESLVFSPRIMGGRVGLHPITIIIAVMTGTTLLGGLLGGILAIPLTAALRVVMFRYVWKRHADAAETASENKS
jgi:predicted PurR-regulated permease PerM